MSNYSDVYRLDWNDFQQIKNAIDFYAKSYENIILISNFNDEISDSHMDSFCAIYHLKSLIKEPTCYR